MTFGRPRIACCEHPERPRATSPCSSDTGDRRRVETTAYQAAKGALGDESGLDRLLNELTEFARGVLNLLPCVSLVGRRPVLPASLAGGAVLVLPALIFIFAVRKYLFAMWGIANR